MQHFLAALDYPGKDESVVTGPDPLLVGSTHHVTGRAQFAGLGAEPSE
jgi:hypothetical protein